MNWNRFRWNRKCNAEKIQMNCYRADERWKRSSPCVYACHVSISIYTECPEGYIDSNTKVYEIQIKFNAMLTFQKTFNIKI